jgi:hypothetical protein
VHLVGKGIFASKQVHSPDILPCNLLVSRLSCSILRRAIPRFCADLEAADCLATFQDLLARRSRLATSTSPPALSSLLMLDL